MRSKIILETVAYFQLAFHFQCLTILIHILNVGLDRNMNNHCGESDESCRNDQPHVPVCC